MQQQRYPERGGKIEGAFGGSRLFFDAYICNNCRYSELYFVERTYVYLGH